MEEGGLSAQQQLYAKYRHKVHFILLSDRGIVKSSVARLPSFHGIGVRSAVSFGRAEGKKLNMNDEGMDGAPRWQERRRRGGM